MSTHGPMFSIAGDGLRDCGFYGIDDGRFFSAPVPRPKPQAEPSYDDPDYAPGHGSSGYTIHIDWANHDMTVRQNPGLQGPELPPGFVRNPEQRMGSRAMDASVEIA